MVIISKEKLSMIYLTGRGYINLKMGLFMMESSLMENLMAMVN